MFVVIPQAEQTPKEKKSKEMFLEASFVIEEDSNDDDDDDDDNNNNNNNSNNYWVIITELIPIITH